VTNDLDIPLTDEIIAQLELEDALSSEFCQLSLNALAGTDHGDAMKLQALVKNQAMLTLVDTGSTHSFVSSAFLEKVGMQVVPTTQSKSSWLMDRCCYLIGGFPIWLGGVMATHCMLT